MAVRASVLNEHFRMSMNRIFINAMACHVSDATERLPKPTRHETRLQILVGPCRRKDDLTEKRWRIKDAKTGIGGNNSQVKKDKKRRKCRSQGPNKM